MSDLAWNTNVYALEQGDMSFGSTASGLPFDARAFRTTVGSFATGVIAITYESQGRNYGMTVNSFTSVSLDPPLILVSLMRTSRALHYLLERPFAVNILASRQLDVALHFAGKPQEDGPEWLSDGPAPRLAGAIATMQCSPWAAYDGGDHVLIVARVAEFVDSEGEPLIFQRGRWTELLPDAEAVRESA